MEIEELCCEYKRNPVGMDVRSPRFCWKLVSPQRNVMQTAYQIQVALAERNFQNSRELVWDSGKQEKDQAIQVVYAGPALESKKRYCWRVKAWNNQGEESGWSEVAFWEMGLLNIQDWKAKMIQPELDEDPEKSEPCPLLRKEFKLKAGLSKARLYITAHGLYEAWMNGKRVGDELFTPGWTNYRKCLQYQTYDVTAWLKTGANAIGVMLGDGWYRGFISYVCERNVYGDKLGLYAQLEIAYEDGFTEIIVSDETWKASTGPVLESDIFNGEVFDSRLNQPGWTEPGYQETGWKPVRTVAFDPLLLKAPIGVPVREIQEIKPEKILRTPAGETVVDFGQNLAGWVRLRARGPAGAAITLRHGEALDSSGNFYNKNLRMAKARDIYILKGQGEEIFEPHFTFHGFRYVKVEGYPGELGSDKITAIVIHSDLEPSGEFSCSNSDINRLFQNIRWSQKGNFLDVPTDCPQRDERMGWTGDILAYGPTACQIMNCAPFLSRWLRDLACDQRRSGAVPMVIPDAFTDRKDFLRRILKHRNKREGDYTNVFDKLFAVFVLNYSVGWGEAAIFIPWILYLDYGDKRVLETQYQSMQALFRYREKQAGKFGSFLLVRPWQWFQAKTWKYLPEFYTSGWHFGDWLAPGDGMEKSIIKSKLYLPTVFYALDARILSKTAAVLDRPADAAFYWEKYLKIRQAFQHFLVKKDGRIRSDAQTAYVLALLADLLPEESKEPAAKRLAEKVREAGNRIGTGFLGTPHICQILSEHGYTDVAYDLLLQEEPPSWLYQVKKGATTIWEHWDAIRKDGTFQPERMLSFNHYAYGSIGAWLFQATAGIKADESKPGYKQIVIKPQPGGGLTFAKASYDSIHGLIKSEWNISQNVFTLRVQIPANTSATVIFPKQYTARIVENGNPLVSKNGAIEIGSGQYEFHCTG